MKTVEIAQDNYLYGQDESYFHMVDQDNDMDFRYVETNTYENFELGSGTEFKGRGYKLYEKHGILDKGELTFTYRFGASG